LLCPFAKAVWDQVIAWENFVVQWPQQEPASVADWWEQAASKIQKQDSGRLQWYGDLHHVEFMEGGE